METNDIPDTEVSDWVPMTNPVHLAVLGKAGEELGELISAKDRCIIQGLDGIDPDSGKVNLDWLTDEVADVEAMLLHIARRFNLDSNAIEERKQRKYAYKGKWFDKLQRDLDRNIADTKSNMFSKCLAIQYSDTTVCSACNLVWDTNDTAPPACPRMETKKRLMGGLADKSHWAPLSTTEPVEYVMPLDYPAETLKLMAEQNPKLYIVPFYRELSSIQTKDWMDGKPNNLFLPYLLDYTDRQSVMKPWQDAVRWRVSALFPGRELKEVRTPPVEASAKFEYMIAVDQSWESLSQLIKEHPGVHIMPFHTHEGKGSVPKSQHVIRGGVLSDEAFLDELRRIVRNKLVGNKAHVELVEAVPPAFSATPKAREPQVIKYMMTVDTHADALVQLVKDYPDTLIFPFYTTSAIMPVQVRTMELRLMRPRLVPASTSPSLSRDEFLDHLRNVVKHILTDPPFMIVQPDAQFIEVTPPWDLPVKPVEVPETVEWVVGTIEFNRIRFQYTNYRGVEAQQEVRPIKVWFGKTARYHSIDQFFLKAYDYDRQAERDFTMMDMRNVQYIGASENTGG